MKHPFHFFFYKPSCSFQRIGSKSTPSRAGMFCAIQTMPQNIPAREGVDFEPILWKLHEGL